MTPATRAPTASIQSSPAGSTATTPEISSPPPPHTTGPDSPSAPPRSSLPGEGSGELNENGRNYSRDEEETTETRVYPVRRVVHLKPLEEAELDGSESYGSDHSRPSSGFDSRLGSFSTPLRTNSNFANPSSVDGRSENDDFDPRPPLSKNPSSNSYPLTTRFSHTVTVDGSNLVVTGRDGKLERCEDEVSPFVALSYLRPT